MKLCHNKTEEGGVVAVEKLCVVKIFLLELKRKKKDEEGEKNFMNEK